MKRMKLTDVLGFAGELLAELRVLGGHADRAGVQVADAHHHAAQGHQRSGGEAELLGPEQSADDHVAAGLELTVHLDHDPAAQVVEQQCLLSLGQSQLPRRPGVLDARERRRPGAAVVPADQDHVGVRLGDARGDGADSDLGHQLDADAGLGIGVLEVVDQLGEVLDAVDVVVRRRRDQADSGGRVANLGDPGIDLAPRQLPALARLGALGHLDLQLPGHDQVLAGHSEPAGGHLLDPAVLGVAALIGPVISGRILAALAGVALAAYAVHGDGQCLVGLLANRAVGHRPRLEAPHDRLDRLHFLDGDWLIRELQVEQAPQRAEPFGLVVHQVAVLLEHLVVVGPASVLQLVDGLGIEQVILAVPPILVVAAGVEIETPGLTPPARQPKAR